MSRRVNYADAAQYLGVKVPTLRSMVHRKQVPHIRLSGKLVVFDLETLDQWLRDKMVAAND
jgi:excisionase family DNA binding protein